MHTYYQQANHLNYLSWENIYSRFNQIKPANLKIYGTGYLIRFNFNSQVCDSIKFQSRFNLIRYQFIWIYISHSTCKFFSISLGKVLLYISAYLLMFIHVYFYPITSSKDEEMISSHALCAAAFLELRQQQRCHTTLKSAKTTFNV